LVERDAAINKADERGDTPLLLAAGFGKLEVFHYLTEIGADMFIHDV
jgi:ankyrin repeat protein